jgi:Family of unknown function (DUF5522)
MKNFEEGVDYYLENGKVVFTEQYFIKRGYCCGNKCRHCPYTPSEKGNKNLKEQFKPKTDFFKI